MDILSDLLDTLRLSAGPGYDAVLSAPWGIEFPAHENGSPFYFVSRGAGRLELTNPDVQVALNAGDLVLLPRGDAHILRDSPDSTVVPFESLQRQERAQGMTLRHGKNGAETRLLAGEFVFESPLALPTLRGMDRVIHVRADGDEDTNSFSQILKMLYREGRSSEPGARAACSGLQKLVFIQIVRYNMAEHQRQGRSCKKHPLALIFDKGLHSVTEALHRNPERPWTVAEMADQAAMSRTKFSLRFAEVAGVAPMTYLTSHRMMMAADLLERTDATLEELAERTGYGSEAAFSTAFKREMGIAPGASGAIGRRSVRCNGRRFITRGDDGRSRKRLWHGA